MRNKPPAPRPDTSLLLASLLCNEVYSWSFLVINGTDDLHEAPAWWHKFWLRSAIPFTPSLPQWQIFHLLPKWTHASQTCLLVTKGYHSVSVSPTGHLGLWKACERWATLAAGKFITKIPKPTRDQTGVRSFCSWEAGRSIQGHRHIRWQFPVLQGEGGWEKCMGYKINHCAPQLVFGKPSWKVWAVAEVKLQLWPDWAFLGSNQQFLLFLGSRGSPTRCTRTCGVMQWAEFTVTVVLSALTTAELHAYAWGPCFCFRLSFLFHF